MSEQRLLLAYGIAEYASALDHLKALTVVGERVPYTVLGRVESELMDLVAQWKQQQGQGLFLPRREQCPAVIDEARSHLTDNMAALDDLLKRKGLE